MLWKHVCVPPHYSIDGFLCAEGIVRAPMIPLSVTDYLYRFLRKLQG
jgi:hypothetical protein